MAFTIPNEADAFFAPQASPDATDIAALGLAFAATGVIDGCEVAPTSPVGLAVSVAAGRVRVGGEETVVAAVPVLVLATADLKDRKDIVVVDAAGVVSVVAGVPGDAVNGVTPLNGRDPVKAPIAGSRVLLAEVYVPRRTITPSSSPLITANNLIDKRCVLAGANTESTAAIEFTRVSARALSGHRVVTPGSDGRVDYADPADEAQATQPMWLTLTATGAADEEVELLAMGRCSEPSWAWVSEGPIFVGMSGVLTQVPPTSDDGFAFILQVASPDTATDVFYGPRSPILLGP